MTKKQDWIASDVGFYSVQNPGDAKTEVVVTVFGY
jgi:hypothetical protein